MVAAGPEGAEEDIATKLSPRSVPETVARLVDLVSAKGFEVFTVIDHSGEAERAGLALRNTKLVIFGSPLGGTPVMAAAPLAALDLPLKVLIWADAEQTKVSYLRPARLAERYELGPELAKRLSGIDGLTDALISEDELEVKS
jgi:uncharacterized protein (DUF302 family)